MIDGVSGPMGGAYAGDNQGVILQTDTGKRSIMIAYCADPPQGGFDTDVRILIGAGIRKDSLLFEEVRGAHRGEVDTPTSRDENHKPDKCDGEGRAGFGRV